MAELQRRRAALKAASGCLHCFRLWRLWQLLERLLVQVVRAFEVLNRNAAWKHHHPPLTPFLLPLLAAETEGGPGRMQGLLRVHHHQRQATFFFIPCHQLEQDCSFLFCSSFPIFFFSPLLISSSSSITLFS